jgi:hypothetical protein
LVALKISQENSQAIAFLCLIDSAANCCKSRVFAIVKRQRSLARSDSELAHGKKKKKENRLGRAKVKYRSKLSSIVTPPDFAVVCCNAGNDHKQPHGMFINISLLASSAFAVVILRSQSGRIKQQVNEAIDSNFSSVCAQCSCYKIIFNSWQSFYARDWTKSSIGRSFILMNTSSLFLSVSKQALSA